MKRPRRTRLRGSVTQNTPVRLRAEAPSRFGMLYRLGIVAAMIAVLIIAAAWSWEVGWPQRQAHKAADAALQLTGAAHFAIRDIIVEGRNQTSRESLAAALGAHADDPILAFDPSAAAARVEHLPWVASAVIERRLPDTIVVRLTERVPLARWQHDNHLAVIDLQGDVLIDAKPEQFTTLPLVVGPDAPKASAELLSDLQGFPIIKDKLTAAVRVSDRRWDLHLQATGAPQGVVARLPENDMLDSLHRLQQLITDQKILDRNVAAIDLRLSDRLIIESATPPAVSKQAEHGKL